MDQEHTETAPVKASLFIGRLPRDTREQDLEEVFSRFGRISRCAIKREGYGFVDFEDERDANDALKQSNEISVLGYPVVVELARGERSSNRSSDRGARDCFRCGRPGHFARECPENDRRDFDRRDRRDYDRRDRRDRRDYDRRDYDRRDYDRRDNDRRDDYRGGRDYDRRDRRDYDRGYNRSPVRRSRSPVNRRSRSPVNRRSRSPVNNRSRSPVNRDLGWSKSPVRSASPPRGRSPTRRPSNSPVRRSPSPNNAY